jgi:hypothetical protein
VLKAQARWRQSQRPWWPHQRRNLRGELCGSVFMVGWSCRHRRANAVAQLGARKLGRAAGHKLCRCENRCGALAPRRDSVVVDLPAVFTAARDEPVQGMASLLDIGDIEDGQCGGDSRRGGDRVRRSRQPGFGSVPRRMCAVAVVSHCRPLRGPRAGLGANRRGGVGRIRPATARMSARPRRPLCRDAGRCRMLLRQSR